MRSEISLPDGGVGKNVIIYGVDMSLLVHIDDKKKDILILGIGSTQGLDDAMLPAQPQFSINFSRPNRKFCLSLHYDGSISFLFLYATKIYKFKAKDSEIKKKISLVLVNASGVLSGNTMIKTALIGCVHNFYVDYKTFDNSNIIDIHKYLMKKHDIK